MNNNWTSSNTPIQWKLNVRYWETKTKLMYMCIFNFFSEEN